MDNSLAQLGSLTYPSGSSWTNPEMIGDSWRVFGIKELDIAGELAGKDFALIKAFVQTQGFADAEIRFMGVEDDDPWAKTGATFEQMIFWPGKSEYAIP